jgi:homoserine O-succinyltransferase/O-acetyltransferase
MPMLSPQLRGPRPGAGHDGTIVVGLVNNMPDASLRPTERQFHALLAEAAEGLPFRLRLFSLPELPRAEAGRRHISLHYEDLSDLWSGSLDGLIVTGTEPHAPFLSGEPYWRTLTRLIEWAEDHTTSTIWLCLAAHAAVLHLDGLERRPFREKLSGVFDCVKIMDHAILTGLPDRWSVPHSRYNDLPMGALVGRSYRILSELPHVGADLFLRQKRSLFIFAQGHLEYDASVLLREYRRDVRRFFSGERDSYPTLPHGYFAPPIVENLRALAQQAIAHREAGLPSSLPTPDQIALNHAWRLPAMRIYSNWMKYLSDRKSQRGGELALKEGTVDLVGATLRRRCPGQQLTSRHRNEAIEW